MLRPPLPVPATVLPPRDAQSWRTLIDRTQDTGALCRRGMFSDRRTGRSAVRSQGLSPQVRVCSFRLHPDRGGLRARRQDDAPVSCDVAGPSRPRRGRTCSIVIQIPTLFPLTSPQTMEKSAVLILLAALVAPIPAAAQQEEGDVELELTGTLITSVGAEEASGMGMMQAKVGRFVTDRWELGAFPSFEVRFSEGTTDTRIGAGVFATYSYLQPDAKTVPYAGASYYKGDASTGFDAQDSWFGLNGGMKFYFNPRMAFDMGADYLFALQGQEGQLFIFRAGLSIFI